MYVPDMSTDDFVEIDFNSAESFLNIELLEAIRIAVNAQVQMLLEMYTPLGGDQSAFPLQVTTMLARVIGPLQNNVRSIKERVKRKKSLLNQALLVTDMRQISQTSILARVKHSSVPSILHVPIRSAT